MLRMVGKQIFFFFFHSFLSLNKVRLVPVEHYKMQRLFISSCCSVSFTPHSSLISKIRVVVSDFLVGLFQCGFVRL